MTKMRSPERRDAPAGALIQILAPRAPEGRIASLLAGDEGAQLLEFAMVLPFLLVFVVGIIQFGGAFNLKQKMANAAREAARIMVSNILADSSCSGTNCSAQAAASAVANYMTNAGVDSSCLNSAGATSAGTEAWTFACNGITLTINHQYVYASGGAPVTGTQVTLTYPYKWFFNDVIRLLVPNSNLGLPSTLTETAVMENIASN